MSSLLPLIIAEPVKTALALLLIILIILYICMMDLVLNLNEKRMIYKEVLFELNTLSVIEKCEWLTSPAGATQIREWLALGLFPYQVAMMLHLPIRALHVSCNGSYNIAALTGKPLAVTVTIAKPVKEDLTKPPAYRIVTGYSYHSKHRGEVIGEYHTAEELWQSDFIRSYFSSFGCCEMDYFENYLKEITRNGIYQISNNYIAMFCEVNQRGIIKILKSTS